MIVAVAGIALCLGALFYYKQTQPVCMNAVGTLEDIRHRWADGTMIALVRHTEKCADSPEECGGKVEGLTAIGQANARRVGIGFSYIDDSPALILHSPLARTTETARIMFPDARLTEKAWLREGCRDSMMPKLLDHMAPGQSMVAVTHSTCINALTAASGDPLVPLDAGDDRNLGIAIFVDVSATPEFATCIRPREWPAAIGQRQ